MGLTVDSAVLLCLSTIEETWKTGSLYKLFLQRTRRANYEQELLTIDERSSVMEEI